jgi:hypothetical protein
VRRRGGRLSDAPRCGASATFTPEAICRIMAMGCEDPEALDVPISHWSHSEPARRAVARGTAAKPLRADDERQAADDVRPREEGWDLPSRTGLLAPQGQSGPIEP